MFSFVLLILRDDAAGLAKIGDGEVRFDAGREFMFVLLEDRGSARRLCLDKVAGEVGKKPAKSPHSS